MTARLPLARITFVAAAILLAPVAIPALGQDANVLYPPAEIEERLRSGRFEIVDLRGSRMEGDRTQRVALRFEDGETLLAKWAQAPPGGDAFNNHPRYELAAYEFQKLFLDEAEYVVPPTVVRAFPLDWYRERVDPDAGPTFRRIDAVLVALQYWLFSVTDDGVYSEKRLAEDPAYARHLARASLFGYLVGHRDANVGNFLVSTVVESPRVFAVDNGHAFGLEKSDRGTDWSRLRVDRLPARAVARLRAIEREDLDRALATLVQFEVVGERLRPAEPGEPLDRHRGTRVRDGVVQLGLTADEIARIHGRIRSLLGRVDGGEIGTLPEPSLCDRAPPPPTLPAPAGPRLDAEYGLWVTEEAGRLGVGWITRREGPGRLAVLEPGGACREHATPPGRAHRVTVSVPERGTVRLRYGSATDSDDRHETTVELGDPGRHGAVFSGVDSLYVVGDVHGAFESLTALLRNAGLIDETLGWNGGRAHLVALGDVMDRGPDVTRALWFLHRLEREATRAGGAVHVVLGNHELMVLFGDLRYTHSKELGLAASHGVPYNALFDVRRSVLGRWLASMPGILRVDDTLLAHGGVGPRWTGWSAAAFDDSLAARVGSDAFHRVNVAAGPVEVDSLVLDDWDRFLWEEDTVFWLRDWVQRDDLGSRLDAVLDAFDAERHVVGHTPVPEIVPRYDGRVIAVDLEEPATGMLLLERSGGEVRRWRIRREGPPEPL